jgi:hypothetical protein
MGYNKIIICLANSRKKSGRCIAGKIRDKGRNREWVRPVSHRPSRQLLKQERCYEDKSEPNLLDIILVPLKNFSPLPHQRENHLINTDYYWQKENVLAWKDLSQLLDSPASLWQPNYHSYSGLNDRIPEQLAGGDSLYLIALGKLVVKVGKKAPEYSDSKRKVQGNFSYKGIKYRIDVTDPIIEDQFLAKPDGSYTIKDPILCISLGDPYNKFCYKLIAAVLFEERFH